MEQGRGDDASGGSVCAGAPGGRRIEARIIDRRVGLPTGRAVIGALLVTLSVVGLFTAYRRSQADAGTPYVIVARTIAPGAVISEDDLAVRQLELGDLGERTFTATTQVVGSVAIQTLLPGQLLQEGTVLAPSDTAGELGSTSAAEAPSPFELSFALDRARALNGALAPGEVVDVVATLQSDGTTCSFVVAPRARVVATRGGGEADVIATTGSITVTVSVDDTADVLGLVHAVDEAEVTIVRSTRAPDRALDGTFCGDGAVTDEAPTEQSG